MLTGKWFDVLYLLVFENQGWTQMKGLKSVDFIAKNGLTFADYKGATHPSGPNYRTMLSGQTWSTNEFDGVMRPCLADKVPYTVVQFAGIPAQRHNPFLDMDGANPASTPVTAENFMALDANIVYLGMDDNNDGHSGPLSVADANVMRALAAFNTRAPGDKLRRIMWITTDEGYGLEYASNHVWTGAIGDGVKIGQNVDRGLSHYNFARWLFDNFSVAMPAEADPATKTYAGDNILIFG